MGMNQCFLVCYLLLLNLQATYTKIYNVNQEETSESLNINKCYLCKYAI